MPKEMFPSRKSRTQDVTTATSTAHEAVKAPHATHSCYPAVMPSGQRRRRAHSSYLYPPKGVNFGPLWRFLPWGRLLFPEVHFSFFMNRCQWNGRLFTSKGRLLASKGRLLPGSVLARSVLVDTGLKY